MCVYFLFLPVFVLRPTSGAIACHAHFKAVGQEGLVTFEGERAGKLTVGDIAHLSAFAAYESDTLRRLDGRLPGVGLQVQAAEQTGAAKEAYGVIDRCPAHTKTSTSDGCAQLVDCEACGHLHNPVEHSLTLGGATHVPVGYVTAQSLACEALALVLIHHSQNYNQGANFPKKQWCFCSCRDCFTCGLCLMM